MKLRAILAGNSTKLGVMGADWWIKYYGKLPDYYISRKEAKSLGWKPQKANLGQSAPGKMIFGGEYFNDNGKLPQKAGRKWYEADINYETGKRNKSRILFSNDGHIFIQCINIKNEEVIIKKGERIAQAYFQKYLITDDDIAGGIRTGGFGSTTK